MSLLLALTVLAFVAATAGPAGAHLGGDECAALGGLVIGGECRITGPWSVSDQLHGGPVTINETLHILGSGSLFVPESPGGSSLTLNIAGSLIMESPTLGATGRIVGDATTSGGVGAAITINVTGDIELRGIGTTGALISSNHPSTCGTPLVTSDRNAAGNITLNALGDITLEAGTAITANSMCRAGEISVLAGGSSRIDGLVSSEAPATANGRGNPITVTAGCDLIVGNTATVSSKGRDPGADLVHLQGGCSVVINGLVQSTGPGHQDRLDRRCHAPLRPDKPAQAPACVEVWSGGTITINSAYPNRGEINADTAQIGGVLCCPWIDLYAAGEIQINGNSAAPYSVHSNQARTYGFGGYISVKSTQDRIWARGLAIQGDATLGAGDGGIVTIEASGNVTLDDAQVMARGDYVSTGGYGIGGRIAVRSYTGGVHWTDLFGGAASTGDVQPTGTLVPAAQRGTLWFTYCSAIDLTGTAFPTNGAATTPVPPTNMCGGEPALPSYVTLPACTCGLVQADVSVSKSTSTPMVTAGETARYSITVMSIGSDEAANVVLTDQLPGALTWAVSGPDAGACSIASGVLTCAFGTMPPSTARTISLSAATKIASCPALSNSATVVADVDVDRANNSAGPVTVTVNCPDVSVTKTTTTPTVLVGDSASYTIVVTAGGTGTSTNVKLTDTVPTGMNWSVGGANASSCAIAGGVLTCNFGAMTLGSTRSITLTSPTAASKCGNVTNTATVTADVDANTTNSKSSAVTITVKCPDVRVTKTAAASSLVVGDTATYTITVTSGGSGNSENVTLTDSLPGGLTWAITGGTGAASCSIGTGTALTCTFGTILQGSSKTVVVSAKTNVSSCPSITNVAARVSATVNTSTTNDTAGPVTIAVSCPLSAYPDVSLSKVATSSSIAPGNAAQYTLAVTNNGPGTSSNVTLTDALPAGLTWVAGGIDGAVCSITGGVLTCPFGALAQGAIKTVTLTATTTTANCGTISNIASVSTAGDSNTANNSAGPVTITVVCPDVSVVKTTPTPSVNVGGPAIFNVSVLANGPGSSTNVVLTDSLPAGLAWSLVGDTAGCSTSAGVLTCSYGTMAEATSKSITLTATTAEANCPSIPGTGTISNSATVSSSMDGNASNNSAGPVNITLHCPDPIAVTKITSTPVVNAGDTVSYSITVTDPGPGPAYNVVLTDVLPAGLAWTVGGPDAAACTPSSPVAGGTTLTCNYGTFAEGESRTVTLTGTTTAANCPSISNTATVSAVGAVKTAGPAKITVNCGDVSVVKSTSTPTIAAGDAAVYTLMVAANGPGASWNVVVSDPLPTGLTWTVSGADSAFCSIAGGVLTCNFGNLPQGATRTVTLTATTSAANCPSISNTASVTATTDAKTTNNSSGPVRIVVNCPDVSLTKTTSTPLINVGDTAVYTITVTAGGTGNSSNVTLSDPLPGTPSMLWTLGGADAAFCAGPSPAPGGSTLQCVFGSMAQGTKRTITLSAATTTANCPGLTNTATVSSGVDVDTSNNTSASAQIALNCPDVSISKTASPDPATPGEPLTYTIVVTNVSGAAAANVVVTDPLPDGTSFFGCSVSQGTCGQSAGVVTASVGTLPPSGSATISLTVIAPSVDQCSIITNTATVTAVGDANPANNSATATTGCGAQVCTLGPQPPNGPAATVFLTVDDNGDVFVRADQNASLANDNSYGANAIGWPNGHKFGDLTGSDHAEFIFRDANGNIVLDFFLDYLSAKSGTPSGYGSLGVSGGDGNMISGSAAHILAFDTSLDRNLNDKGFCNAGNCTVSGVNLLVDSPPADANYNVSNAAFAAWEFVNSYEVKISHLAFGAAGFGSVTIGDLHNSPAKTKFSTPLGVCPTPPGGGGTSCSSSVASNFNATAIAAGRYIWFNSVFNIGKIGSKAVTIRLTNSTIQFTANGTPYTISVPDALITFSPTATSATTAFDAANNRWVTTVPSSLSDGNTFLAGVPFLVPVNFPGGINPVTWNATFTSDTPGLSATWKWAAAVYSQFSGDGAALGVKPIDDSKASVYKNSDKAGTPESFKSFAVGGARGGGGSNYTGSYSGTKSCGF